MNLRDFGQRLIPTGKRSGLLTRTATLVRGHSKQTDLPRVGRRADLDCIQRYSIASRARMIFHLPSGGFTEEPPAPPAHERPGKYPDCCFGNRTRNPLITRSEDFSDKHLFADWLRAVF